MSHPISASGRPMNSATDGNPLHPIWIRVCPSFRMDFLNRWKPWCKANGLTAKSGDPPYYELFTSEDKPFGESWPLASTIRGCTTMTIATVNAQYSSARESITVLKLQHFVNRNWNWWTPQKSPDRVRFALLYAIITSSNRTMKPNLLSNFAELPTTKFLEMKPISRQISLQNGLFSCGEALTGLDD